MNLLILSDNHLNALYSEIEEGSIGYYPDLYLYINDYNAIKNSVENTYILALITNDQGLSKLFSAKLSKLEESNGKYKLSYVVKNVISSADDIYIFNKVFPYAFKDENNAKLSQSKELIKIVRYLSDDEEMYNRISIFDTKSLIINSDAFRLQGSKTQVYKKSFEEGVHSKLSHSIRVDHIAKCIANKIEKTCNVKLKYDLIENIAVAINIGEPPFGYVAEQTINEILRGDNTAIYNVDLIGFSYFKHNLQSARILERVDPVCMQNSNYIDLDVISGIIGHSSLKGIQQQFKSNDKLNEYFKKYYINDDNLIGKYAIIKDTLVIPRTLEAQIVRFANEIAEKAYDVELSIRGSLVDNTEIETRLSLLSEVTGHYFECDFNDQNERYYTSRVVSDYIENFLIDSVCSSFKFDLYKNRESRIDSYLGFSHSGEIVLSVIDNYFQSKLLLSRKVRLFDHNARQMISNIFTEIYNDVNLLPQFYKNQIMKEFKNSNIKDINIVLCFISLDDGQKYLNNILYSDLKKVRNKQLQALMIRKREIIIQVIIDYITSLSDAEAIKLNDDLMHN